MKQKRHKPIETIQRADALRSRIAFVVAKPVVVGQMLGTPSFMPPEQIRDSSKIDDRVPHYRRKYIDQLIDKREIFEYWSHAAAYLPIQEFVGTPQLSPIVAGTTMGLLAFIAFLAGFFVAGAAASSVRGAPSESSGSLMGWMK